MVYKMKNIKMFFSIVLRNSIQYFVKAQGWGILEQITAILRALLCTAGLIATQRLFDAVTESTISDNTFYRIVMCLGVLTIIVIAQQVLSGIGQYLLSKVSYTNMGKFMVEFQHKLGRFPAVYFEDVNFLNKIDKAKECLEYESLGHFASICLQLVTYYLVYFLSIGGYLFSLSPFLVIVLLAAFIPAVIGQVVRVKYFFDLEEASTPLRRCCEHYKEAISDIIFYKETRILGAFYYFFHLFVDSLHTMTENRWKMEKKIVVLQSFLNGLSFLGLGVSVLILFHSTMNGDISIGAFTAVFVTLTDVFAIMDDLVSSHLSEGSETLAQVINFYELMDMDETNGKENTPDFSKGIMVENATFTYPGCDKAVVNDVSLKIKSGETIAVVGENGSGKSTLVKLLTGLYLPDEGIVNLGDVQTQNASRGTIYEGISGIFQNYQKYKITLAENVVISATKQPVSMEMIENVLREAEFDNIVATLDTVLSPEFGGIDLSGGQWQRLAIARGLYRINDFIVLDEPTAAIDPIEESRLYKQFKNIVKGRCAVIVTHRLGSVKFADYIIVMDNGSIVESGTHDELLIHKGKYAEMWKAQAAWYTDEHLDLSK